jgi:D-amino-acid oxidase
MPGTDCDVLVVGAGVSGLTTAICLAEAGARTVIQAAVPPAETTSAVAGAIWGPHLVEDSPRTARWRRDTLAVLRDLAVEPGTGVRIATGVEAARPTPPNGTAGPGSGRLQAEPLEPMPPAAEPDWLADLGGAAPCRAEDLPAGFAAGWRYAAPLVHMPTYLGYLAARFRDAGGRIEARSVRDLAGAARDRGARVVVNCTGTGARELAADPAVTAFRGQVVLAENPGITEFFIGLPDATTDLVYLFPHGDTVVLGGTEVAGDWNTAPVPAVAERIVRDCAAVDARLAGARVLAHRVGLRPFRPEVRLEAAPPDAVPGPLRAEVRLESAPPDAALGPFRPEARLGPGPPDAAAGPVVVHNYGHGGAGITLSWGCARQAAALAAAAL